MPELSTNSEKFIAKFSRLHYIMGLSYFWCDSYRQPFLIYFNKICTVLIGVILIYGCIPLFITIEHLSSKHENDLILFFVSHPILYSYYFILRHYRDDIQNLLYKLIITLKKDYNDLDLEKLLLKRIKICIGVNIISFNSPVVFYAVDAITQIIMKGGTFTTIVVPWPGIRERGFLQDVARVMVFVLWSMLVLRASASNNVIICLTSMISIQFKNLQSYFYSLQEIFESDTDSQEVKERKYEDKFKFGISMHAETLRCVKECQKICTLIFSGQIVMNFASFSLQLLQVVSVQRTLPNTLSIFTAISALLGSTGFIICNAGEIIVEASKLPTAIFFSGWQNCRGASSSRIRKLATLSIAQSQRPVALRSFNVVELSYQSYVTIVKTSYSVFSLLN